MNRKQRRALSKTQRKKGNKEKDLAEKMMLFDKIPEECLMCEAPFDKKDKEMGSKWNVTVRESQNKVHLYCPECWEKAHKMVAAVVESMQEATKAMEEKLDAESNDRS